MTFLILCHNGSVILVRNDRTRVTVDATCPRSDKNRSLHDSFLRETYRLGTDILLELAVFISYCICYFIDEFKLNCL